MLDEVGGTLADAFTHGFEDAGLGDATEIIGNRRPPARFGHVEPDCERQAIGLGDTLVNAVRRDAATIAIGLLVERIDAE